jgi:hypothetical protein
MFGPIGIGVALSALSTVTSLIESAASEIGKAAGNASAQATGESFTSSTGSPAASSLADAVPGMDGGPVLPKFNDRMQAMLLAYQEMHRGG